MKIKLILLSVVIVCMFQDVIYAQKHNQTVDFQILYTNDNHGWMDSSNNCAGAAGMYYKWKKYDGYKPDDDKFLVVSGGDLMTGPASSVLFRGRSMVEVLNKMGFDAAVVGNHEFDFTVDTLKERTREMNFPLLAADILNAADSSRVSFAKPFQIFNVAGLKVAIIGLASSDTPTSAAPVYVKNFIFINHIDALNSCIGEVENLKPDVIILAVHQGLPEVTDLLAFAKKHNIQIILNGHYHNKYIAYYEDVLFVQAGCYMRSYIDIKLSFNKLTKQLTVNEVSLRDNNPGKLNKSVKAVSDKWSNLSDKYYSEIVSYASEEILSSDPRFCRAISTIWLKKFPECQISFNNMGGMRQNLSPGTVSLKSIIGVMPFDNKIVKFSIRGDSLIKAVSNASKTLVYSGMSTSDGIDFYLNNGEKIISDKCYKIVTSDYIYSVIEEFKNLESVENTGIPYNVPVVEYLKSNTSKDIPINTLIK